MVVRRVPPGSERKLSRPLPPGGHLEIFTGVAVFKGTVREIAHQDLSRYKIGSIALQGLMANANRFFEVSWRGKRVPMGAEILGHKIRWTQDGKVAEGEDRHQIGVYGRTKDGAGRTGKEQQMVIGLFPQYALRSV